MNIPLPRSGIIPAGRRLVGLAVLALGTVALVPSVRAQLYSQNFNGGTAPGWTVASGSWSVVGGTGGYYTETTAAAGPNVAYYGTSSFDTGFTYTASVRLWGSGSGNETGVVYYYQNSTNYYEVELNPIATTGSPPTPTGNVRLIEHIGSASGTVAATGTFSSNGGGNYQTVTVVRSGTTTTIKINGVTVITRVQSSLTGGGYIGACGRYSLPRITNITVTDTGSPTVAITTPADGTTVSGTTTVAASASDGYGISSVQFKLDVGTNLGAAVTSSPYQVSWDTTTATNGSHMLTAVATNVGGVQTTSSVIGVTVNNATLPSGWNTADVGSPGATGSASYSTGTYTVTGAGADIWGTTDAFRYAYETVSGGTAIIARVATQQNTNLWAKAGVMFRESTAAGAVYVATYVTPTNGLLFEYRTSTNGVAAQVVNITGPAAPEWLRLVRDGNTFYASYSSDGSTWSSAGSITVSMAGSVDAGLAVCSHAAGTLGTATFTNVSITGAPTVAMTAPTNGATVSGSSTTVTATASANSGLTISSVQFQLDGSNIGSPVTSSPYTISWDTTTATNGSHTLAAVATDSATGQTTSSPITVTVNNSGGGSLPAGWSTQDIGSPGATGSAAYSAGTYTISGAGADIYGTTDAFRYVYESAVGDYTIVARVITQQNTNAYAKAGVMFRESTAAGSIYVGVYVTPTSGLLFEYRSATNGSAGQVINLAGPAAPEWLKLARNGNTFTAYYSTNGTAWTSAGSVSVTMATTADVGLAVLSHAAGTLCTATFDNVSITAGGGSTYAPNFPRLGIYAIGMGSDNNGQKYTAAARTLLGKFHVVILGGAYESWGGTLTWGRDDVVSGIKNASTVGTKVFQYVDFNESSTTEIGFPTWEAKVDANHWWAYVSGTSDPKVVSTYNSSYYLINMTHFSPVDASTGWYPYEWAANFAYNEFYLGTYSAKEGSTALDGFFLDNTFWEPNVNGDWDRNGTLDQGFSDGDTTHTPSATIQTAFRTGEKDFFTKINSLMPAGKISIGNNGGFAIAAAARTTTWIADLNNPTAISPLQGTLAGGVCEHLLGGLYGSPEGWASQPFAVTMSWYEYCMNAVVAPKLQLVEQTTVGYNGVPGADSITPSVAYQAMRYGLCFTLMNDGYYNAEKDKPGAHSGSEVDILWFDEYDNVGAGEGYLGQPVSGSTGVVQTAARWTGSGHGTLGVWAREFANGLVILNPIGNGPVTITTTDLGGSTLWKRISGTQAPTINNGQNVTSSITLQDRDGIILLRR